MCRPWTRPRETNAYTSVVPLDDDTFIVFYDHRTPTHSDHDHRTPTHAHAHAHTAAATGTVDGMVDGMVDDTFTRTFTFSMVGTFV